jgi:hypothetical protein
MPPVRRLIKSGNAERILDDKIGNAKAKRFEFLMNDEVEVKVKVKEGKTARAKPLPADDPPSQSDFTLARLVMNLEVPGGADEIEIHVKAQAGETKLAYFLNNRWKIISQARQGGFFIARIKNWPEDPSIGAGR